VYDELDLDLGCEKIDTTTINNSCIKCGRIFLQLSKSFLAWPFCDARQDTTKQGLLMHGRLWMCQNLSQVGVSISHLCLYFQSYDCCFTNVFLMLFWSCPCFFHDILQAKEFTQLNVLYSKAFPKFLQIEI